MKKQRDFYPRVYVHNKAVIMEMFRITYNQSPKDLQEFEACIIQPKRPIDPAKNYFPVLQKKLVENLGNLLGLDVTEEILKSCTTVDAIQKNLSTYGKRLRINASYRKKMGLYDIHAEWFTDGSKLQQFQRCLSSYLYNVPSDRYLMENPTPKLKELSY